MIFKDFLYVDAISFSIFRMADTSLWDVAMPSKLLAKSSQSIVGQSILSQSVNLAIAKHNTSSDAAVPILSCESR